MNQTKEMSRDDAMKLLLTEINTFDQAEKADFCKAWALAPHLVLEESDPRRFLRSTNWNVASAARGIVAYWRRRRQVFGDEKAFLPLSFAGGGALSPEVIEFIRCGNVARLPDHPDGTPVFVGESIRRPTDDPEIRLRAYFVFTQLISEAEGTQSKRAICLSPILDRPRYDEHTNTIMNSFRTAFPMKPRFVLYVNHLPKCSKWFLNSWMPTQFINALLSTHGRLFRSQPMYYLRENSHAENLAVLEQKYGFERKGLPVCLGGTWSYREHDNWVNQRIERDKELYSSLIPKSPAPTAPLDILDLLREEEEQEQAAESFIEASRRRCEGAVGVLLSQEECQFYVAAKGHHTAGHALWEEECNMDWFLQYHDYHFYLAAKHLARYWRLRSECFGAKQYKPLHQTGDGALGRRDIPLLQKGFVMLLSNEANGCPIIFIDGKRMEGEMKAKNMETSLNRCLFYMFSLLMENERSRTDGAVLLFKSDSSTSLDCSFIGRLVGCLPIRFKAVHVLSLGANRPSSSLKSQLDVGDAIYVHRATSRSELSTKVEEYGLSKPCLPKFVNGDWDYAKFVQWKELRTRIEWKVPLGLSGRDTCLSDFPAMKKYAIIEDKKEKERRLNAIHSRRKRDRTRVEMDILKEEEEELLTEQESLMQESSRLTGLVASAKETVDSFLRVAAEGLLEIGTRTAPGNV